MQMWNNKKGLAVLFLATGLLVSAVTASAESYRWKDKDGNTHYGAAVPAEYADMPYDVLNSSGQVIRHVEDSNEPLEEVVEEVIQEKTPLVPDFKRRRQQDRLLVLQYDSEEAVTEALELEIAQVGSDFMLINKSYDSTRTAIRGHIRQASDQQRSGKAISEEQNKEINKLYRRLTSDEKKMASLVRREERIRTRFATDLEHYKRVMSEEKKKQEETKTAEQDQG